MAIIPVGSVSSAHAAAADARPAPRSDSRRKAPAKAAVPLKVVFGQGAGFRLSFSGAGADVHAVDNDKRPGYDIDARAGVLGTKINLGYTGTVQISQGGRVLGVLSIRNYGRAGQRITGRAQPGYRLGVVGALVKITRTQALAQLPLKVVFEGGPGFKLAFPLPDQKRFYTPTDNQLGRDADPQPGSLKMSVNKGYSGVVRVMEKMKGGYRVAGHIHIKNYGTDKQDLKLAPPPGYTAEYAGDGTVRFKKKPGPSDTDRAQTGAIFSNFVGDVKQLEVDLKTDIHNLSLSTSVADLKERVKLIVQRGQNATFTLGKYTAALATLKDSSVQQQLAADAPQFEAAASAIRSAVQSLPKVINDKKEIMKQAAKSKQLGAIFNLMGALTGGLGALSTAGALFASYKNGVLNYIPMVKRDVNEFKRLDKIRTDRLKSATRTGRPIRPFSTKAQQLRYDQLKQFDQFWGNAGVYGGLGAGLMGTLDALWRMSTVGVTGNLADLSKQLGEVRKLREQLRKELGPVASNAVTMSMEVSRAVTASMAQSAAETDPVWAIENGLMGKELLEGRWLKKNDSRDVNLASDVNLAKGSYFETDSPVSKGLGRVLAWKLNKNDKRDGWFGDKGNFSPAEVKIGKLLGKHLHNLAGGEPPAYWKLDVDGAGVVKRLRDEAEEWKKAGLSQQHETYVRYFDGLAQLAGACYINIDWSNNESVTNHKIKGGDDPTNAPIKLYLIPKA
jgi:hypothetical protein